MSDARLLKGEFMRHMKVFGLLAAFVLAMAAVPRLAAGESGKPGSVKLDLYVMSQCPFGTKAEDAIFPAVKSLGKHVDFNLYFIANEEPALPAEPGGKPAKTAFKSLHGQPEVDENIRHLCAMKNFPKQYMDFILERNINIRDGNWQAAAKKVGIDPAKLEACSAGEEGAKLLSDSIKITQARGAGSSPTIDLNGSPYMGARGERSITLAVCDALGTKGIPLPDACEKAKNMPPDPSAGGAGCEDGAAPQAPPVAFDVTVLTDRSCAACGEPTLIDEIKDSHTAARITVIDVNSEEGKAFIKLHDVRSVPYYFLEKKVESDPNFSAVKGFYAKTEDGYFILPGSDTYMPALRLDRKRVPHHLDLFVESNSPFTAQVEAQLTKFLAESDIKDLTFSIHYIVQETVTGERADTPAETELSTDIRAASIKEELGTVSAGPLTSRRGQAELLESMRQVCLFQHASAGTFFTYLTCRNQNLMDTGRGDTCLQMSEPIQQCLQGPQAEALLRQDAKLVRDLEITGGPVFLWENQYGPFGWYEADWKRIITEKTK